MKAIAKRRQKTNKKEENTNKPPIGVMPLYLWLEFRLLELSRYLYERSQYCGFDLVCHDLAKEIYKVSKWQEDIC